MISTFILIAIGLVIPLFFILIFAMSALKKRANRQREREQEERDRTDTPSSRS